MKAVINGMKNSGVKMTMRASNIRNPTYCNAPAKVVPGPGFAHQLAPFRPWAATSAATPPPAPRPTESAWPQRAPQTPKRTAVPCPAQTSAKRNGRDWRRCRPLSARTPGPRPKSIVFQRTPQRDSKRKKRNVKSPVISPCRALSGTRRGLFRRARARRRAQNRCAAARSAGPALARKPSWRPGTGP